MKKYLPAPVAIIKHCPFVIYAEDIKSLTRLPKKENQSVKLVLARRGSVSSAASIFLLAEERYV
jgi:hypothetical protein